MKMQLKFKKLTTFFKYNKKSIYDRLPKKYYLKMSRDDAFYKTQIVKKKKSKKGTSNKEEIETKTNRKLKKKEKEEFLNYL